MLKQVRRANSLRDLGLISDECDRNGFVRFLAKKEREGGWMEGVLERQGLGLGGEIKSWAWSGDLINWAQLPNSKI